MAFDFPATPTNGQQFTPPGGPTYTYDLPGTKWLVTGTGLSGLSVASTTDVLTGTSSSVAVTPDALAALWEKGTNVASAATITFPEGGYFHVTGTVTITDIDWAVATNGRWAWVIFDTALTLTHSATLLLPGNANILTAANDRACFIQDASDNAICLAYQRAATAPVNITTSTYTPGTALGTNVSAANTFIARYMRVANTVFVTGRVDIDAITAGSAATFYMGLPIAPPSNFVGGAQAGGVFNSFAIASQVGGVASQVGGTNVQFDYIPTVNTLVGHQYMFSYEVT